jgi:hypothetical protein
MKYILPLILIINTNIFAQNGKVFDTYKSEIDSTNESHGTIFPKPFQSYNYIKTHRGIEVYETYKTKGYSTNESRGTIFSKPFPTYIIIDNKMYSTYKNKSDSTNESHNTIFTKPFESKQILNINTNTESQNTVKVVYEVKYKEPLPKYNGEGDITYGE